MGFDWALGASVLLTALLAAMTGIWFLALIARNTARDSRSVFQDTHRSDTLFVFDGETLIDASPAGRALLSAAPMRGSAWQRLMGFLALRFPQIDTRLANLQTEGRIALNGSTGSG